MNYHSKGKKYSASQTYTDLDGNTKSFTVINHDPKAIQTLYNPTEDEKNQIQEDLRLYKKEAQDAILKEHPSLCPLPMQPTFTIRNGESIIWNSKAVKDEGLSLDTLRDLHTLVFKRKELYT
jgi:hypothetical protein